MIIKINKLLLIINFITIKKLYKIIRLDQYFVD